MLCRSQIPTDIILLHKQVCCKTQRAATSVRAFYKLGTEPLPMGLEKLIRGIENLIIPNQGATGALWLADCKIESVAFRYQCATEALWLADCNRESVAFEAMRFSMPRISFSRPIGTIFPWNITQLLALDATKEIAAVWQNISMMKLFYCNKHHQCVWRAHAFNHWLKKHQALYFCCRFEVLTYYFKVYVHSLWLLLVKGPQPQSVRFISWAQNRCQWAWKNWSAALKISSFWIKAPRELSDWLIAR